MKNNFKKILLVCTTSFFLSAAIAQNVSLNMLVLNSGVVPLGGNGTVQATVNAATGTSGQSTPVAAGKINVQITVPPSLLISTTQSNLPAGWIVRNNNGTVINICNSTTTIEVNTAVDLLIDLQGVTATTGAPTMSGQLSFRTNCSAPGSLGGDNPSDNSSQAGFTVTGTVPVKLSNFSASLINCLPVLNWETQNEINSDRFEIEKADKNLSGWIPAGSIATNVNSTVKNKYSFIDNNIPSATDKVFYRLKMIDKNGSYTYSTILPVFINCKNTTIHVYPNPVQNGSLNVSLTGVSKKVTAQLLSVTGKVVARINLVNGTNRIPVVNIADGEYILLVNFENGTIDKVPVLISNNK